MSTVLDVAKNILKKCGPMTAMKLQKLVYYSQAWSLVWDEKPLFRSRIEAWANGPVSPQLYQAHRGMFQVAAKDIQGDAKVLNETQRETVDAVIEYYGDKSSQWLSDLTHQERPWKEARGDLSPSDRGKSVITHASMTEYYGSL